MEINTVEIDVIRYGRSQEVTATDDKGQFIRAMGEDECLNPSKIEIQQRLNFDSERQDYTCGSWAEAWGIIGDKLGIGRLGTSKLGVDKLTGESQVSSEAQGLLRLIRAYDYADEVTLVKLTGLALTVVCSLIEELHKANLISFISTGVEPH